MRLLLVSYDYPALASPQSIRWAYLVRELVALGHEIHVLAPALGRDVIASGLPEIPAEVNIRRVNPGLFTALIFGRGRTHAGRATAVKRSDSVEGVVAGARKSGWAHTLSTRIRGVVGAHRFSGLNWKGIVAEYLKAAVSLFIFPDHRGEWAFWARRALPGILKDFKPDLIISSHEPASTLVIARIAHRKGIPWVADLGDPVLSSYTLPRWYRRTYDLERDVCKQAELVTVTTAATMESLKLRHSVNGRNMLLIPQGFDSTFTGGDGGGLNFDGNILELLYTGSLYAFRRIDSILEAITGLEGVRLTVATPFPPDALMAAAAKYPEKVRVVGVLLHRDALAAQRLCDVLVNIANDDPVQIPGKVYEYLQARRPILHIAEGKKDAAADYIEEHGFGWVLSPAMGQLQEKLQALLALKRSGAPIYVSGDWEAASCYSWQAIAERLSGEMKRIAGDVSSEDSPNG